MNASKDTSHTLQENKERWKKKINGDDLENGETRNEMTTGTDSGSRSRRNQNMFERTDEEETGRSHDRKYALYWDQTDDPSHNPSGEAGRQNGRRTVDDDGGRSATGEEGTATNAQGAFPFRRRRFEELKSMQERKKESAEADQAFNYGWVDY